MKRDEFLLSPFVAERGNVGGEGVEKPGESYQCVRGERERRERGETCAAESCWIKEGRGRRWDQGARPESWFRHAEGFECNGTGSGAGSPILELFSQKSNLLVDNLLISRVKKEEEDNLLMIRCIYLN